MKTLVFNGWAAGPETWELTTFPRDWIFSYLEQLDGLPERVLTDSEEAVLVGFSMGGNSALRLLMQFPEKIRGLVLISTTPFMLEDKAAGWKGLSDRRLAALRLGTQIAFRGDPSPLYAIANMDRGLDYLRTSDLRTALESFAATHQELVSTLPVCVFQSRRDGIVNPANADWLQALFPRAWVMRVPGNEHVLPVAIPEWIDLGVNTILERNEK